MAPLSNEPSMTIVTCTVIAPAISSLRFLSFTFRSFQTIVWMRLLRSFESFNFLPLAFLAAGPFVRFKAL